MHPVFSIQAFSRTLACLTPFFFFSFLQVHLDVCIKIIGFVDLSKVIKFVLFTDRVTVQKIQQPSLK